MDDIPNMPATDENSAYDRYASDEGYYTELMSFLSESHSMRETAKSAVKQSLYAASGAFAGSFIGGPLGGLLGGIAGSVIGYVKSDNFDGAIVALTKLESARQKVCLSCFPYLPCFNFIYARIDEILIWLLCC